MVNKKIIKYLEKGKFYKAVIEGVVKTTIQYGYLIDFSEEHIILESNNKEKYIMAVKDISIIAEVENERV